MIHRNPRRCALVLCMLAWSQVAQASAINDMQDAYIDGRYKDVVTIFQANQEKLEKRLYEYKIFLCETWYALRSYSNVFSCAEAYIERMDGRFEKSNHVFALGLIAIAYDDLGDYERAAEFAKKNTRDARQADVLRAIRAVGHVAMAPRDERAPGEGAARKP